MVCSYQYQNQNKCGVPAYGESEYCLFHKPNKDLEEGTLFWKLLNWDYYADFTQSDINLLLRLKKDRSVKTQPLIYNFLQC
jgi:hypothetical protein